MTNAILFDLDGTLWDSSEQVVSAWNKCIEDKTDRPERFTVADMHGFMGKTLDVIAAEMFPSISKQEQLKIIRQCFVYEEEYIRAHRPRFFENEQEILTSLSKKYRLAIVSNCQVGYIELFMGHCGYPDLFCDFESAGATGLTKGQNIRLVMQRQGIDRCIYVGDTRGDELAAREAGVTFIHAAYGFGTADAPDGVINSLEELPLKAEKLFNE